MAGITITKQNGEEITGDKAGEAIIKIAMDQLFSLLYATCINVGLREMEGSMKFTMKDRHSFELGVKHVPMPDRKVKAKKKALKRK
jgi:hypothetical protein